VNLSSARAIPLLLLAASLARPARAAEEAAGAVPVRVVQSGDGSWTLLRGGAPYFIRGAGGDQALDRLAQSGGNSFRTWGSENLAAQLGQARALGLTVLAGFWLGHKGDGFDWSDPKAVAAQQDQVLDGVRRYKDDPSVLAWGLGNEMEADNDSPALWTAIGALARAVKALDPNHPIVTVVAEISPEKIALIRRYAPDIDVLGVNSYGGLPSLKSRLAQAGWKKPYIVSEFGPRGPWESTKTAWGALNEPSSAQKAAMYRDGYKASIAGAPGWCLGSYAFLWGFKDEGTATWFGMLMPESLETLPAVDAMSALWTGRAPQVTAPEVRSLAFVGAAQVSPSAALSACADVRSPGGPPALTWRLRRDAKGAADLTGALPPASDGLCVSFAAPADPGPYRLYLEVRDGGGRGAADSLPFLVLGAAGPAAPR
jgi:hypothetical protein